MNNLPHTKTTYTLLDREIIRGISVLALLLLVLFFLSQIISGSPKRSPAPTAYSHEFESPHLSALSAVVYDISDKKFIYSLNGTTTRPLASLTKLMTALVAAENLPQEKSISITQNSIREEGDSGLKVGEKWNVQSLIDYLLMTSSNDGTRALAAAAGSLLSQGDSSREDEYFLDAMNASTRSLMLSSTRFYNDTGLDLDESVAGAYGSASDTALLISYIASTHPEILSATRLPYATFFSDSGSHKALNTNEALPQLPGFIGGKTGYTDLAGGNLAVVVDISLNRPVAIVVLGSTRQGRFDDIVALTRATENYFRNQQREATIGRYGN